MEHVKALIIEGNPEVRISLEKIEEVATKAKVEGKVLNAIYYLEYGDLEPDVIIIGDELTMSDAGLESCRYFPVDFGNKLKEICKHVGKKVPKIVVLTTMRYYNLLNYETLDKDFDEAVRKFVRINCMQLIEKCGTDGIGWTMYDDLMKLLE